MSSKQMVIVGEVLIVSVLGEQLVRTQQSVKFWMLASS